MDRNRSETTIHMKTRKMLLFLPVLILAAALIAGAAGLEEAHADALIWHEVDMDPGDTYNVSKAKWNTTVFITEAGDYYLKGKSENVRVIMEADGARLHLEDGLNINATSTSYTGSRTAAIWVKDVNGTMEIISEEDADAYLEGYMCPAIRKEGTKSTLIFDTETPSNPGTITAKAGAWSAAIGSVVYMEKNTMGNIIFNGGNIKASAYGAAAIGGSDYCSVSNITINGGNISATTHSTAAAIGGGAWAGADGISISGGKVYAECSTSYEEGGGAAIGSGDQSNIPAKNITIDGGTVEAVSKGDGAGIGAGYASSSHNLRINGGRIKATCERNGVGIGSGHSNSDGDIHITDGTIYARGNSADIGADKGAIKITGGSVSAKSTTGDVVNDDDQALHRVDATCRYLQGNDMDFQLSNLGFSKGYSYGGHSIYLMDCDSDNHTGMFYPWLPDTDEKFSGGKLVSSQSFAFYYSDIKFSDRDGFIDPATNITLTNGDNTGSATGFAGQDLLGNLSLPACQTGTVITGLYNDDNKKVADPDGKLVNNVVDFTDADGCWIYAGTEVTLNAQTRPCQYTVHFDGNQPRGASTKISGNTADLPGCEYDKSFALPASGFTLPGYDFTGWNTKADGSGSAYKGGAMVEKSLTDKDGDTVTLYAQWSPKKYNLTLSPGDLSEKGAQSVESPDISFDTHSVLPAVPEEWKDMDNLRDFHCWVDENGNHYYDDGEDFCNLVKYKDGNPVVLDNGKIAGQTLTAQWIEHASVAVTVTRDGKPDAGHATDFTLTDKNDRTKIYNPPFDYDGDGIYKYTSPASETDPGYIPPGKYILSFEPESDWFVASQAEIDFKLDTTSSVVFDYYTVSIVRDPAIVAIDDKIFSVAISGGKIPDSEKENEVIAPDDTNLTINTTMNPAYGYHFDGYSVLGTVPGKSDGSGPFDPSTPEQTITVTGQSEIMAHAEANKYTVHFDANSDIGISGEMDDQDMVYDQPQNLFSLGFEKIGATFNGWNTKADGTGTAYTDGQSVKNLTVENGGTVTLYAQWILIDYDISYDLDGGELPAGEDNPATYTAEDSFTLVNPERVDYNFVGWIGTDLTGPTQTVTIEQNSTGDRTYTAVWVPIYYNVEFDTRGGTGIEPQRVRIHYKAKKPKAPTRGGYAFAGWYADKALTTPFDFNTEIIEDTTIYAKWTPAVPLRAKLKTKGKKALVLSWNKASGAEGYDIFFAKCTKKKDSKVPTKKVKTIKGNKTFKWTRTGLKKQTAYKAVVKAWYKKAGKKKYFRTSPLVHAYTSGGTKAYTNAKSVTVKKTKVTLKKGKTYKIKATVKKLSKKKKLMPKSHAPKLRYLSSDKKIATVNKDGKIKGIGKGTCYIYAYAHNGISKAVKVTVK